MDYVIKKANVNDLDEIIILYKKLSDCMIQMQQAYMELSEMGLEYFNEENRKYFARVLECEDDAIFLAIVNEKVVGFIHACKRDKDFYFDLEQYCYIPYYYVNETHRNYSLNLSLYMEAEKWAKEKGLRYICSDVDGGNELSLKLQVKFCGMKPYKIRLAKKIVMNQMRRREIKYNEYAG